MLKPKFGGNKVEENESAAENQSENFFTPTTSVRIDSTQNFALTASRTQNSVILRKYTSSCNKKGQRKVLFVLRHKLKARQFFTVREK